MAFGKLSRRIFLFKSKVHFPAALSPALLSVTALLSALRMPFSNMGKEEQGDTGGKQPFSPRATQNGDLHFPPHSLAESCPQSLRTIPHGGCSFTRHQAGQIHPPGLTSHGCSRPAAHKVSCCTHNMTEGPDATTLTSIIGTTHKLSVLPAVSFLLFHPSHCTPHSAGSLSL